MLLQKKKSWASHKKGGGIIKHKVIWSISRSDMVDVSNCENWIHSMVQHPQGKKKKHFYCSSKAECVNKLFMIWKKSCLLQQSFVYSMKRRRKQEPKELLLSGLTDSTPWTCFSLQPSTPFPKLPHWTKEPSDEERHRLTSIYTAIAQCLMCDKYKLVSKFPLWMKNMDDKHIWFQFNFVFFWQIYYILLRF